MFTEKIVLNGRKRKAEVDKSYHDFIRIGDFTLLKNNMDNDDYDMFKVIGWF